MLVMGGDEATRRIREWETNAQLFDHRTPIIALTANALKGEKEKCLAADMDDYLAKPIDLKDLHRALLKFVNIPGALAQQ
ncbi:MAG: response regulator [Desulfobacteraceae bacterium]